MFEENNKRISQKNYKNLLKKHFYKKYKMIMSIKSWETKRKS